MVLLEFYGTSGLKLNGVVIGRSGNMLKVAFDSAPAYPARVVWINPQEQIGKLSIRAGSFNASHPAIKMMLAGKVAEAEKILLAERAGQTGKSYTRKGG